MVFKIEKQKKMKKFRYAFAVLGLSLILTNCSEDFLEKTPIGRESPETFYLTQANCEMAVTAAYNVLITRHGFSRNYWFFGDCASDDSETGGEDTGQDQVEGQRIDQLLILPGNLALSEFYNDMYQGIFRCNLAIENIPKGQFDAAIKNRLINEARFLRAFFHYHLNVVYGGVRIVDHALLPEEYEGSRNSVAEVLHFVQKEMSIAAANLPSEYGDNDKGRASSGAALGYKLKALVFESSYAKLAASGNDPSNYFVGCVEKWDTALMVFTEIVALGVHSLEPDFFDLWPVTGENSSEHMFTGHSVSLANGGIEDINTNIVGGVHNVYQSCRSYFTADSLLNKNGRGQYGLNCPTPALVEEFETGDPRLDISFTMDYDPIYIYNPRPNIDTVFAAPSADSPTQMTNSKYDPFPWEWIDPAFHHGPRDLKFLRYADVILLAAEAAVEDGNPDLARELLNRIRERARNSGSTGVPAELTGTVTLNDVMHERRCELALEAHRYFDIVRWGIADEVLTGTIRQTDIIHSTSPEPLVWVRGKHEFFPIPELEIIINKGLMLQNPGY